MKTGTLKFKLLVGGIVAALVPMAIVGIFAIIQSSNAILELGKNRASLTASNLATMTEMVLEQEMKLSRNLARERFIAAGAEKVFEAGIEAASEALAESDESLEIFLKESGGSHELLFTSDSKGNVISDSMGGSLRENKVTVADRDYFQAAKSGKSIVGKPVISKASGNPVTVVATPMKTRNGQFAGVFGLVLKLDALSEKITQIKLGETGYPFMVAKDGTLMAHPDKELIFKLDLKTLEGMEEITKQLLAGESGVNSYRFRGVDKVAGFAPVPATGWSICVTQNKSEFMETVTTIRTMILMVGVVFILLTIFAILWFVKGIMQQLGDDPSEIAKVADSIAKGDLTYQFGTDSEKITGVYANMKLMADNLQIMFKDISNGVQTLTSSATELSAVSSQMTSGAEQTSDKSNTVASAAEEMSSNMNSVAAATEETTTNIQTIVSALEQMSGTINEIAANTSKGSETTAEAVKSAEYVSGKVNELGNAASEINKVTETIADISEQTNLLALNATIEAARAGEAGKGFAVVASEIKALAQQTAAATDEIGTKIGDVQKTTGESVSAIGSIVKIINEINMIVTTVATAIEEQSATTSEISSNVGQAAAGVQEVNENVNMTSTVALEVTKDVHLVSQAAEQIKSGSGQVNESAVELSQLAETLNEMVGRFKLK